MHLSFKSVCNKEHKGVICYTTPEGNSSQSTRPTGRVLWEELLFLSRFHLELRVDEWNFCPLHQDLHCLLRQNRQSSETEL